MSLFENLAATDDTALIAQRKASAVANKRVKDRFGAFLANAHTAEDLNGRLALVAEDITQVIQDVVAEHGGDAQKIEAAIKHSIVPGQPGMGMGQPGMGQPGMGAPGGAGGAQTCPQCGGPMVNGACPTCQGAVAQPGGAYGQTHSIPQGPSTGPIQASHEAAGGFCDTCHAWKSGPKAGCTCDGDETKDDSEPGGEATEDSKEASVRESRRPKLCPYHSEVVDISLGAGDPQAGFNAMSAHAWGDKHCKGEFEGNCNFRPAMVSQQYWDDKRAEYDERREQRELERQNAPQVIAEPDLSIETEPIMHAEPLAEEPGKEGVSDIDGALADAPSAVGGGELAVAASTRQAEALKTVDLPTGNDTALGGPSPKIDKGKSGDQNGWNLDPIDTQMKGTPHPTVQQDPTDKADYKKTDFLDQTGQGVTKQETLPTGKGLDGGGFASGGEEHGDHTDTWSGKKDQANPVTRDALSAVDPDKNPLAELIEEYSGFLMPNQVESAIDTWSVG